MESSRNLSEGPGRADPVMQWFLARDTLSSVNPGSPAALTVSELQGKGVHTAADYAR